MAPGGQGAGGGGAGGVGGGGEVGDVRASWDCARACVGVHARARGAFAPECISACFCVRVCLGAGVRACARPPPPRPGPCRLLEKFEGKVPVIQEGDFQMVTPLGHLGAVEGGFNSGTKQGGSRNKLAHGVRAYMHAQSPPCNHPSSTPE